MLPGSNEGPQALGGLSATLGHWDEGIAYYEQALALDPRNVGLLTAAAWAYAITRQFPAALKLYGRALDIVPNAPEMMAWKASAYQAQGNLQEAAKLLDNVNAQTNSYLVLEVKITQLRLERNYGEAIRLLEARLAQFHYDSQKQKGFDQADLAWMQRLAGDTAGAKVTFKQARNTLEQPYREEREDAWSPSISVCLTEVYAAMGDKDAALKVAERAVMLRSRARFPAMWPQVEENLALMWKNFGENSRAIATLSRLLQTPYMSYLYSPMPITSALLRLDPIWDPLRADPAFQKLCQEKQP